MGVESITYTAAPVIINTDALEARIETLEEEKVGLQNRIAVLEIDVEGLKKP